MTYKFERREVEYGVHVLVEKYPQCFFDNPRQRRPLKKNIVADLEKDGCPLAPELISASVDWYQSHFGYLYALETGSKRIDLNGEEVGTVTAQEQMAARKKIHEDQERLSERNAQDS